MLVPGVGEGRSDPKVNTATGVVDTVTGGNSTVTWADIVRTPASEHVTKPGPGVSAARGQEALKKCKFVSRSFYRNNPVNRTSKV